MAIFRDKVQVMDVSRASIRVIGVVAACTFPTQKETTYHHSFVFTDDKTYWRVFVPSLTQEQQEAIAELIASKLDDGDVWWV